MLKMVSFILCENIYLRIIIFGVIIAELFRKKTKKEKKHLSDLIIGSSIIFLNNVLNIDFVIINFLFLGILSSILHSFKIQSFLSGYFCLIGVKGVLIFCVSI